MSLYDDALSFLGISPAVGRFLLAFSASVPCSYVHRFIINVSARHAFAALTGAVLSYYAFGATANLHFAVTLFIAYASMLLARKHCRLITFLGTFTFLIACHAKYMSGDAWKEGGIDFTGALMILTLKAISVTTDYQDGLLLEENCKEAQKQNRINELPSLLEFLGFTLCCGTHLAGPVYGFKDYLNWQRFEGDWNPKQADPPPIPFKVAGLALAKALLSVVFYVTLGKFVDLDYFSSSQYQASPPWLCFFYMYIACVWTRWKYYFIWSISECALVLSGLGFCGWKKVKEHGKEVTVSTWDRAKNYNILGVELADSAHKFPLNWNISVGNWLRFYVYERLTPKGKKPGFWELMITQVVSAVWHGLYPGYLFYFVHTAVMISGSKVIYRYQRAIPAKMKGLQLIAKVAHGIYAGFVNDYSAIGFVLLSSHDTILACRGVYFIGTFLPVAIVILGLLLPAPRLPKLKKEE